MGSRPVDRGPDSRGLDGAVPDPEEGAAREAVCASDARCGDVPDLCRSLRLHPVCDRVGTAHITVVSTRTGYRRVAAGTSRGGEFTSRRRREAVATLPVGLVLPVGDNRTGVAPGGACPAGTAFVIRRGEQIRYQEPSSTMLRGVYRCAHCGHPATPIERARPWDPNKPWRMLPHTVPATENVEVTVQERASA